MDGLRDRVAGAMPIQCRLDAATVRAAARNRWPAILEALGIAPPEALTGKHRPCPACGGRDRFRFDDRGGSGSWICSRGGGEPLAGDGFALVMHSTGCTFAEALREVARSLSLSAAQHELPARRAKAPERPLCGAKGEQRAATSLRRAWIESEALNLRKHTPARRYFEGRGLAVIIDDPPDDLRFHPGLNYWETDEHGRPRRVGEFPALLGVVTALDGQPVSLHRTYLTSQGTKAIVSSPRKMMTPATPHALAGASIRLYPCDTNLAVAEGLETALAGRVLARKLPVWSAVNSTMLAALVIPPDVREITILADHDRPGREAARRLARRLLDEGRTVRVAIPPEPGTDWLDVLSRATTRKAVA